MLQRNPDRFNQSEPSVNAALNRKRVTAARLTCPFDVMFVRQSHEPDVMKRAVFQRSC